MEKIERILEIKKQRKNDNIVRFVFSNKVIDNKSTVCLQDQCLYLSEFNLKLVGEGCVLLSRS